MRLKNAFIIISSLFVSSCMSSVKMPDLYTGYHLDFDSGVLTGCHSRDKVDLEKVEKVYVNGGLTTTIDSYYIRSTSTTEAFSEAIVSRERTSDYLLSDYVMSDLLMYKDGRVIEDSRSDLYAFYYELLNHDRDLSYIGWQNITAKENEAQNSLASDERFELNVDYNIPIWKGRHWATPFFNTLQFSIHMNTMLRVTGFDSSPITPVTNSFGVDVEKVLFNFVVPRKTDKAPRKSVNRKFASTSKWLCNPLHTKHDHDETPPLQFFAEHCNSLLLIYLRSRLEHFSNGLAQPGIDEQGFNDYAESDFSTNYFWFTINGKLVQPMYGNILRVYLGWQWNFGPNDDNLFKQYAYLDENYGYSRMLLGASFDFKFNIRSEERFVVDYKGEWITDGTPKYVHSNRNYFSHSLSFKYVPSFLHSLSFYVSYFDGRDYLHNRFDRPVSILSAGLLFDFNKRTKPYITFDPL